MANQLTSFEIIKILDNLVGPVEPVGETNADKSRLTNLKTVIDIIEWGFEQVIEASKAESRPEASMHEIGWNAKNALNIWKRWLDNLFGE